MMTKEEFLAIAATKYEAVAKLKDSNSFYDMEKDLAVIVNDLGRLLLQETLGDAGADSRKKKCMTRFGKLEIAHSHRFQVRGSHCISPYLQDLMVYAGATAPYGNGQAMLQKFLEISVSRTQIYRLTNQYGNLLEEEVFTSEVLLPKTQDQVLYVETDGSMVLTEDGWKEVKIGRIFLSDDLRQSAGQGRGGQILQSSYLAHPGNAAEFTAKFSVMLSKAKDLGPDMVFLCDGAEWIWLWVNREYPEATQILDFHHAAEHLGEFAAAALPDPERRGRWIAQQKALLLAGRVAKVMNNIAKRGSKADNLKEQARKLQGYYRANQERMRYDQYIKRGLSIGSGAIESAHRTLVQSRLKLSGQYWTEQGAQQVLNLRSLQMSGHWDRVVNKINATVRGPAADLR